MKKKVFSKLISWILSLVMVLGVFAICYVDNLKVIAASDVVERAISWAIQTANDDSHGYSQKNRWGPDYDCSSFVISAFKSAGVNTGSASYTGDMRSQFTKHDFTWIAWSNIGNVGNLRRGDVLLKEGSHTEIYLGNNQNVGAHSDRGYPQTGDQTGTEVSVSGYYYHPWDGVLRYNGYNDFPGAEDTSYAVPVWLYAKQHDNTYDSSGNIESNRWIDAGDYCLVKNVYKNGFCFVDYPGAGGERRLAYAKASLFDIPIIDDRPKGHEMSESEAAGRTIPDGDYYIESEISQDYFIDIPGDDFNTENGKNVAMWIWDSQMPHRDGYDCFRVEYLNNGFYRIRQTGTNMCLDVNGASLYMSENIQMWENNGSTAQQWSIEQTSHGYRLRARCNAYYMDIEGGTHEKNTNIRCWEGNDSKAQSFSFIPHDLNEQPVSDGVYTIKTNTDRNCFLDVGDVPGNFYAGSNIQIWRTAANDPAEKYTIKYVGDGWYKICEKTSGLLMELADPNAGFLTASRNVQVFSDNGGKHQLWKIKKNSDGTYFIINKASGYYLDLEGGNTNNWTNVSQYPYNGNNNQRWYIEPYTNTNTLSLSEETITMSKGSSKTITVNFSGDDVRYLSFYIENGAVCTGSWGTVEPGKCPLTLCGQGSGKTTLTVSLLNSSEQKIISKNITVNVFTFDLVGSPIDFTPVGEINITNSGEIPLVEEEHKYTSKIVKPTCTEQGYTLHICSECGNSYKDNYTSATGHSYGSWTTTKQPTCTADGIQQRKCSVCGNTETQTIKATGHSYTTSIVKPTCTSQGYTVHTCSRCSNSYKDSYTSATGHSYGSWTTTKQPTCTADGTQQRKCSVCGKIETQTIKATGHSYTTSIIQPTYTEQGYTLHTCSKCGHSYKDNSTNVLTKPLVNKSTISKNNTSVGGSIIVTTKASGGSGGYNYAISYKKSSDSSWSEVSGYSSANSVTVKIPSAGTYTIRVNVKDSKGTIKNKDFTITVNATLANTSKVSSTSITKGKTVTVTCASTGGTGTKKYAVSYKLSSASSWTKVQDYSNTTTAKVTPSAAGKYTIRVAVKDGEGTIKNKDFTITVNATLANTSKVSSTSITKGKTVTVTCASTGGTGTKKYAVWYKLATDSSWTQVQDYKTYKESPSVSFTPKKTGKYDVSVKVKDGSGTIVKKSFTVTIKEAALANTSKISSDSVTLGTAIKVTFASTGGTGTKKYAVWYKLATDSSWTQVQDYKTYKERPSVSFTPKKTGKYDVSVKVKDGSGAVVKKSFTVTIKEAALANTSKVSSTTINLGDTIKITCSATGSSGFYKYAVYYKKSSADKWSTKQDYSPNSTVTLKPASRTTYNVCVKVQDDLGNISKKNFTITVK